MTPTAMFVSNIFISTGDVSDAVNGITFPRFSRVSRDLASERAFGQADNGKGRNPLFMFSERAAGPSQVSRARWIMKGGKARRPSLNAMKVAGRRNAYAHLAR